MQWKNVWPPAVLAVALAGLAFLPAPSHARADEARPDAAKIDKLIEQLGSDAFKEREEATKSLDGLGEPALEKLKEAAKNSTDAEIRKRATGLVAKIGTRVGSARVLSARMVHLVYKDTPIKDAVADFAKQSGYAINVVDPDNKLKDKKVTLDTGKTTFWDAMEKFNAAAGLTEANPVPAPVPGGGPFPGRGFGGGLPGAAPVPAPAAAPGAVKKLLEAIKEREKKLLELEKPAVDPKKPAAVPDSPVALVFPAEDKPAVGKPVAGGLIGGIAVGGAVPGIAFPPGGGMIGMPPGVGGVAQPGAITVTPGKADALPADTKTSVRIRVAPDAARAALGTAAAGKLTIALQAAPEPRLRWQQLLAVTIDKAIDDNEQKLTQAKVEAPPAPVGGGFAGGGLVIIRGPIGVGMPGGGGLATVNTDGLNYTFPVVLEKGAKESKKLTVLEGSITARFLGDATPYIEVKDVMKAKGKTVKGDKGGAITVNSVEKAGDGTIQIAFEFEAPPDVIAETGAFMPPGALMPGFGIGVMPAPAIAVPVRPLPVKPVAPPGDAKPAEKPGDPKPADKPAAAGLCRLVLREEKPPVIKVEVVVPPGAAVGGGLVIGGAGVVIGGPGMPFPGGGGFAVNGLTLQDDKGKTLPAIIQVDWKKLAGGGPAPKQSYIAVYRPQPGQPAEPSKLVFTGRATSDVTVPFKLENVDVK